MTSKELKDIIDFIKKDPEAVKRIDSIWATLPDEFGLAGTFRNTAFQIADFGAQSLAEKIQEYGSSGYPQFSIDFSAWIEKNVCTGIASITSEIIQKEINKGNPLFKNFVKVTDPQRLTGDTHHATVFTDKNGDTFVLDYHSTLNTDNPMVFKSKEDWDNMVNGQTAEDYFKQNPISDNSISDENSVEQTPISDNLINYENSFEQILSEMRGNLRRLQENIK